MCFTFYQKYFHLSFQEGTNEVEIIPSSNRSGQIGNAHAGGVDVTQRPPTLNNSYKKHQEPIKDLIRKRQVFDDEKTVLVGQASVLEKYSSSLTTVDATKEKLEEFLA